MKKLVQIEKIVVHPGRSHADEILAVMLAEASTHDGNIVPVFRRTPTEDDIADNRTLVMDIGGKVDDWAMVFDHHQLPRDAEPECAFSLLAKEIDAAEDLEAFFDWFTTWRKIDSKGPFAWARDAGVSWDAVSGLLNPVSDLVQDWFEEAHDDAPVDETLVRRLQQQGRKILATAERFHTFCMEAEEQERLQGYTITPEGEKSFGTFINGVRVFDLTWASYKDAQEFGNAFASRTAKDGIIVSRDDRGPGLALFRRNDDPRVDFARLEGDSAVIFAHPGGFIAKTTEGAGWRPLVEKAITDAGIAKA